MTDLVWASASWGGRRPGWWSGRSSPAVWRTRSDSAEETCLFSVQTLCCFKLIHFNTDEAFEKKPPGFPSDFFFSSNQDGRLRTGDHILRIGATPTTGLTSDQVVKALQGCGSHVTMLIARDPRGQRSTGPHPPPPPDSAPVSSLSPRPPELPPQRPDHAPQRCLSKTVSKKRRTLRWSSPFSVSHSHSLSVL